MKNLIGKRFEKLVVISVHHKEQIFFKEHKNGFKYYYLCKCDCGNEIIISGHHLLSKHTKSCGCLNKKHNKVNHRLYKIWAGIKTRCYNNHRYKYNIYGARGIKVCEEWKNDFSTFYNWAINNGYKENLTIDRIDVNGNYEPSNCRWATNKEQANNKRNNHLVVYNNEKHTLAEWAVLKNINIKTLYSRINTYKWSIERALET